MGNRFSDSDSDSERDLWDDSDSDDDTDCSNESEKEFNRREREERRQAREAKRREHSPSRKRAKEEMKYRDSEDDSDAEHDEYDYCYFTDKRSSIKIDCDWKVDGFSDPNVHDQEDFFMKSNLYAAGTCNQFQFFFIMEKLVGNEDTHWGVYANILSNIKSEATVKFKIYVVNHKNDTVFLNKSKDAQFPRKAGYRFLGSINKDRYIDDDYYQCSYMEDGDLTFRFKIEVNYKSSQISNELEQLFGEKREKDVSLIVKGKKLKANKKVLIERSPTFVKLLEKEKTNKLKIDDIQPDIMKQLLIFIYTNKAPKLFSLTDKLSTAADKYKVKDLQVMCKKVKAARKLNPQLK